MPRASDLALWLNWARERSTAIPQKWRWWAGAMVALWLAMWVQREVWPTDDQIDARIVELKVNEMEMQTDALNSWMACAKVSVSNSEKGERCRQAAVNASQDNFEKSQRIRAEINELER